MKKDKRPASVTTAVQLLYITIVISIVCGILGIAATKDAPIGSTTLSPSIVAITLIIAVIIGLFFIINISRGRNWARLIYLILFALSLINSAIHLKMFFNQSTLTGVATIANYVITLAAMILLYQKSSNQWFKQKK